MTKEEYSVKGIDWAGEDGQPIPDRVGQCPVCDFGKVVAVGDNLSNCSNCTHIFQSDLTVRVTYDVNYVLEREDKPHEIHSHLRTGYCINFLDHIILASRPQNIKVLDIGYGNGAFLKVLSRLGISIYGIEVHGGDFGIPEVHYDTGLSFNLVTFFDSLEHMQTFSDLAKLKTECVLVSLPYTQDWFLSEPDKWRHYRPGEHLHYFSVTSLSRLMDRLYSFKLVHCSNFEDIVRGQLNYNGQSYQNIITCVYR